MYGIFAYIGVVSEVNGAANMPVPWVVSGIGSSKLEVHSHPTISDTYPEARKPTGATTPPNVDNKNSWWMVGDDVLRLGGRLERFGHLACS